MSQINFFEYYFKENEVLFEGGSYGHIDAYFQNDSVTFEELKKLIGALLSAKLKNVYEKSDGINLLCTVKDQQIRFSRNKSHLKKTGNDSLTLEQLKSFFENKNVQNVMSLAASDLQKAFSKLSKEDLKKYFEEGKFWLSLEVISESTRNVIDYGNDAILIPHGILKVDEEGNLSGLNREAAEEIFKKIQKLSDIDQHFKFELPNKIQLPDLSKHISEYVDRLNKQMLIYNLTDKNIILDYKIAFYTKTISAMAKTFKMDFKPSMIANFANKVASVKGPTWNQIKKNLTEDQIPFCDELIASEKKIQKDAMKPLDELFTDLGILIMTNIKTFLTKDPAKATKEIKSNLEKKVAEVKAKGDPKELQKLSVELERLNKAKGTILPLEGLVFEVGNKTYKITSSFAAINQILGINKYNK